MKKTTMILLLMALTAVVVAEVTATKESPADILIQRVMGAYEKSVKDADDYYQERTDPAQIQRYGKIVKAGDIAIKKLNLAKRTVSEIEGIKLEQQIAIVRKSLDELGDVSKTTPKATVLAVCGVEFKGHRYLAIASNVNWKEAVVLCKKMGGHLAYVETADEAIFLAKNFRGYLWVGATDAHKEGDWRWGNRKSVARNLWGKNEPNGRGGENYAVLVASAGGTLNDCPLSSRSVVGFICEWE
jgi:hypothetical protein